MFTKAFVLHLCSAFALMQVTSLPAVSGRGFTTYNATCDFEEGNFCNWSQEQFGDKFDWTIGEGKTPTDDTGPDAAQQEKKYAYIKTKGRALGDKAQLTIEVASEKQQCLKFYYYMYGRDVGELNVYQDYMDIQPLITLTGPQGKQWKKAYGILYKPEISGASSRLVIEAVVGIGEKGDIAIDNIQFLPRTHCNVSNLTCPELLVRSGKTCLPSKPHELCNITCFANHKPASAIPSRVCLPMGTWSGQPPVCLPLTAGTDATCDFEYGACGWKGMGTNGWVRKRGRSSTSKTGPSRDHTTSTGGRGYYVFVNSTNRTSGNSTSMSVNVSPGCLSFYYFMYGSSIGRLNLYTNDKLVFTAIGQQGHDEGPWKLGRGIIQAGPKVRFEAVVGDSELGDIALDDISLATTSNSICSTQSIVCPQLDAPHGSQMTCSQTGLQQEGSTCTFSCNADHFLYGPASVRCLRFGTWNEKPPLCMPIKKPIKLEGGPAPHVGRVLIRHQQSFGTICKDGWTLEDANVVCRMLNFSRAVKALIDLSLYPKLEAGTEIWADNVHCNGNETSLIQCTNNGVKVHNCDEETHKDDVGVKCQPPPRPTPPRPPLIPPTAPPPLIPPTAPPPLIPPTAPPPPLAPSPSTPPRPPSTPPSRPPTSQSTPLRPPTNKGKQDKRRALTTTEIVGAAVGGAVLIIIIVIIIACCLRRKRRSLTDYSGGEAHKEIIEEINEPQLEMTDPWEVHPGKVTFREELGEGAFGKVYRAILGELPAALSRSPPRQWTRKDDNNGQMIVAVKTLHETAGPEQGQEFLREIKLMKKLGSHTNIVNFLCSSTVIEPHFLVVEFLSKGDLLKYLRKNRSKISGFKGKDTAPAYLEAKEALVKADRPQSRCINTTTKQQTTPTQQTEKDSNDCDDMKSTAKKNDIEDMLTPQDLLSFSYQIAAGMEYLSNKGFVHRDLAARNVLVADNKQVKVADFGLTRHLYEESAYHAQVQRKLPIKWMSPEAIYDQVFTSESDVWAYGIVLWEIATLGGAPYPGLSTRDIYRLLRSGHRMEKPDICSEDIYKPMKRCWEENPNERPSFTELRKTFEDMLQEDNPYLDLSEIDQSKDYYLVPSFNSAEETSADCRPPV